jgi:hypothetical protein
MTRFIRLHAGGIVRNGAAVLLVGPSGAGKSTLVLRMLTSGFALLSDDEVWVEAESRLAHPSPRSLLLKESAWDLFPGHRGKFIDSGETTCRSWWLSAEDVRPGCRAPASPIQCLVVIKPPSGDPPSLVPIGQTEALTTVLAESMNFPDVRDVGLTVMADIVQSARLFRLDNGELHTCAEMLSRVLP